MGNKLIQGYDINKEPVANGGINSHWKIYKGSKQDKTKRDVAIFEFSKKNIPKNLKNAKEDILLLLRKEA
jgi:hypothetical protein